LTGQFVTALVGAPFGLRGFVKLRSASGDYENLRRLDSVLIRQGEGLQSYEVEETVPLSKALAVKFRGIDSPEAAKALQGAELLVDRDQAAPLGAGEFYVEDLKGIAVSLENGEVLGEISDVVEGGGGDLVELRLSSGERRFVPFRKEFFGDIVPEERRAVLLNRWILE
jgi:16S rRNA processing protein RimM